MPALKDERTHFSLIKRLIFLVLFTVMFVYLLHVLLGNTLFMFTLQSFSVATCATHDDRYKNKIV